MMQRLGMSKQGSDRNFQRMDHIFTLHSIIEYHKSRNKKVYCAFIDYSKTCDLIDRASLWIKLLENGVDGWLFNVIYNMYSKAKSCVKSNDQMSSFFSCNLGVRQGENLSPILFAIYLKDFQQTMSKSFQGLSLVTRYRTRTWNIHETLCSSLCRWHNHISGYCWRVTACF